MANKEDLIKEFLRLQENDEIDYRSASRYFKSILKHYSSVQDGIANEDNFFDSTVAMFYETSKPRRKADFNSPSGSRYWYSKKGLIRGSDHWVNRVANCDWALKLNNGKTIYGNSAWSTKTFKEEKFGFTKWEDFLLKPKLEIIEGKELLTSFNNKIGRDIIVLGKKKYKLRIEVHWDRI